MSKKEKVLIVDDNAINVAILEELLGEEFELATAFSGEEALQQFQSFVPDLILLDVMMAGIDGYETCRLIRQSSRACGLKIIMVSAKALTVERLEGYDAGADDYVTKPFDGKEVLSKVRVFLRLKTAEEVSGVQQQSLAMVADTARNPLQHIHSEGKKLIACGETDPTVLRKFIEDAHHSARFLYRTFEKVSMITYLKAGRWEFQEAPTSLASVAEAEINALRPIAEQADVTFDVNIDDNAISTIDPRHTRTAIRILLENAIQHRESGGTVTVRVSGCGETVDIAITDDGIGIDESEIEFLFDDFTNPKAGNNQSGAGLNLAIAREIISRQNGTLEVSSELGRGSTFTVRFPVAAPKPVAVAAGMPD